MRSIFISLLILLAGLWGGYSLSWVDQELLVIYAEYTLATTDLGHINAKLIRYRTSILRAIEADSQMNFESITSSLTERRAQIEQPIERFIKAANSATVKRSGTARRTAGTPGDQGTSRGLYGDFQANHRPDPTTLEGYFTGQGQSPTECCRGKCIGTGRIQIYRRDA